MDTDSLPERTIPWRAGLAATLLLSSLAFFQAALAIQQRGLLFSSRRWTAVFALGMLVLLVELGLLLLTWSPWRERIFRAVETGVSAIHRLQLLNLVLFALAIGTYTYLLLGPFGRYLDPLPMRAFLFWLLVLAGSLFLRGAGLTWSWKELLGASVVISAAGYRVAAFLPDMNTHPFTLGWSEASRYYYASLYFSERIYGLQVPPTVLHPSRYLMQAVPFLLPDAPVVLHRAWQVFLWIGTSTLTGYVLARRLEIAGLAQRWLFITWTFLYVLLGAIYYHLQVPVILVLWGFGKGEAAGGGQWTAARFLKSLAVVMLASAWAGISRVNWYPVPAMLGIALYLMEEPVARQTLARYLWRPAAWAVTGGLAAAGTQALYVVWSGNRAEEFTTSFSSDLLWYRLLPNPTFGMGVIIAILLVSLPVLVLALLRLRGVPVHPLRWLGLGAMLLVLFAGGLVVSVKIGGGGDLHNMDAYLALLLVIAAYAYFGRIRPEESTPEASARQAAPGWTAPGSRLEAIAFLFVLLVPAYFVLNQGARLKMPDATSTRSALETIRGYAQTAVSAGQPVLFLGERQLLTFGELPGVALAPDYERVFLMEMAMAGDRVYLGRFYEELKSHRYAYIVSEPLVIKYKGRTESFGEENDAWVDNVSRHVLCYYEPVENIKAIKLQILAPRPDPLPCP